MFDVVEHASSRRGLDVVETLEQLVKTLDSFIRAFHEATVYKYEIYHYDGSLFFKG